jgi:hypothetical protein
MLWISITLMRIRILIFFLADPDANLDPDFN